MSKVPMDIRELYAMYRVEWEDQYDEVNVLLMKAALLAKIVFGEPISGFLTNFNYIISQISDRVYSGKTKNKGSDLNHLDTIKALIESREVKKGHILYTMDQAVSTVLKVTPGKRSAPTDLSPFPPLTESTTEPRDDLEDSGESDDEEVPHESRRPSFSRMTAGGGGTGGGTPKSSSVQPLLRGLQL